MSIDDVTPAREAWRRGNKKEAFAHVSGVMIDATAIHGTADESAKQTQRFRKSAVILPIIILVGPGILEASGLAKYW